jgi:hypothetical protein
VLQSQLHQAEDKLQATQHCSSLSLPDAPLAQLQPHKHTCPTPCNTTAGDTVPLSERITSAFMGQPLGAWLSTAMVHHDLPGPMDLNMEDSEVPVPSTLALPDSQPEFMPVTPFIINNVIFNRVDYVYISQGYHQHYVKNANLGLQPLVGTLSFPGGRGPVAHNLQDLQQVNNLMDQVIQYQR